MNRLGGGFVIVQSLVEMVIALDDDVDRGDKHPRVSQERVAAGRCAQLGSIVIPSNHRQSLECVEALSKVKQAMSLCRKSDHSVHSVRHP